jgi:hypothetical protein
MRFGAKVVSNRWPFENTGLRKKVAKTLITLENIYGLTANPKGRAVYTKYYPPTSKPKKVY